MEDGNESKQILLISYSHLFEQNLEIQYLNGKREGSCKWWYKNGQLMNEGFYKNGKMYGPFISYYENGQIESHGAFYHTKSGLYVGKMVFGNIIMKMVS